MYFLYTNFLPVLKTDPFFVLQNVHKENVKKFRFKILCSVKQVSNILWIEIDFLRLFIAINMQWII